MVRRLTAAFCAVAARRPATSSGRGIDETTNGLQKTFKTKTLCFL